jgi:Mrp family chromosome partitioning ATPase
LELADVVKSLRLHWRASVASVLLAVAVLALFIVTRNQVQPAKRYQVIVDLLVPAIDAKSGDRPGGVPASLLQGQARAALSTATKNAALDGAKVPAANRGAIAFVFSASATSTTITIGAIAPDPDTATAVATSFSNAYIATRAATVADALKSGASGAKSGLGKLQARVRAVKGEIFGADPALAAKLPNSAGPLLSSTANQNQQNTQTAANPLNQLPVLTPIGTVLLVVEYDELLTRIVEAETAYASDTTSALVPQSYAQTVEVGEPAQITKALSKSSKLPEEVILGLGLVLALAAPVLIDRLDHSIRTAKTAAVAFDSIVLTSIPPVSRKEQRELVLPGTPSDGAYRALAATSIATDRLPEAIVVTSPTGTVQDTVAANFAAALAGLGLRVVLVATEARQAWFLDASDPVETGLPFPQLLDLAHRGVLDGALPRALVKTRLDKLLVLPPPNEEDRDVRLDGLRPLLAALSTSDVDVTVIAGPAVLEDPNATILSWTTRSVLWAFETGDVTEAQAKEAASRVALAGASSFGIAMVNAKT